MGLRPVGYFRELAHGRPDGPSLREAMGSLPFEQRERVRRYLESGEALVVTPGLVGDVMDPSKPVLISPDVLTDGIWTWPGDLAYYVGEYGAGLPDAFLASMEANGWSVPPLSSETLNALADELYQEVTGPD